MSYDLAVVADDSRPTSSDGGRHTRDNSSNTNEGSNTLCREGEESITLRSSSFKTAQNAGYNDNVDDNETTDCSRAGSTRYYVRHNYHDHYHDPFCYEEEIPEETATINYALSAPSQRRRQQRRGPRGGVVKPFPVKLYEMLSHVEKEGVADIVSWQPHGRCFIIHKPKRFVEEVMPKYFNQTKFTSFQRQVNLYSFNRLTRGQDRGGYYHELFLRGRADLLKRMLRIRIKGTRVKASASPNTEPCFYSMEACLENPPETNNAAKSTHDGKNHSSAKEEQEDLKSLSSLTLRYSDKKQPMASMVSPTTTPGSGMWTAGCKEEDKLQENVTDSSLSACWASKTDWKFVSSNCDMIHHNHPIPPTTMSLHEFAPTFVNKHHQNKDVSKVSSSSPLSSSSKSLVPAALPCPPKLPGPNLISNAASRKENNNSASTRPTELESSTQQQHLTNTLDNCSKFLSLSDDIMTTSYPSLLSSPQEQQQTSPQQSSPSLSSSQSNTTTPAQNAVAPGDKITFEGSSFHYLETLFCWDDVDALTSELLQGAH